MLFCINIECQFNASFVSIVCRVDFRLAHFLICGDSSLKVLCLVKTVLKKFCQVLFFHLDSFQGRCVPHFILSKANCPKAVVMLTVVKILSLTFKGFGLCLKYIYVRRYYEIKVKSLQTVLFGVHIDVCEW